MSRSAAVLLLVAAAGVWGATFPVVKAALRDAGPLTFIAMRFGLAACFLLPMFRSGRPARGGGRAVLCGLALFSGYLLQTWGLLTTTPARSAFITALSVVLVPLLEPLFGLGRSTGRTWAGALTALAGLAVLLRPTAQGLALGDALTFGCAVAFAIHLLLLQWTVRVVPAAQASAVQVLTTAVVAVPVAGLEGWRFALTGRLLVAVLVCAGLATLFAFWAMTAVQRVLSAATTAVVLAFEPVAAVAVSVALGQDRLGASLVAGGALVVTGVALATVRAGPAAGQAATTPPLDKTYRST